jgi:hypothetical protein
LQYLLEARDIILNTIGILGQTVSAYDIGGYMLCVVGVYGLKENAKLH